MPSDAPAVKVAGVRADGAEVVSVGTSSDERVRVSESLARDQGLVLIPAYDDRRIIAGQGTCGLEVVEQLAELGYGDTPFTVLVPIGGGGLASGVAVAVKTLRPDAHVFGVEPEVAADAAESLREGRIVRWDAEQVGRTAADGMRTSSLGQLTFQHLSAYADGVLTVSEIDIRRAMVLAARGARLIVEPSGATPLAAWLSHEAELPPGPVVAILSGGNVDGDRYAALIAEGLAAGG
jgi:threonine dehydratase